MRAYDDTLVATSSSPASARDLSVPLTVAIASVLLFSGAALVFALRVGLIGERELVVVLSESDTPPDQRYEKSTS